MLETVAACDRLRPMRVGIVLALLSIVLGFGLGGVFGVFEDDIKEHLKVQAEAVSDSAYQGDAAAMKKVTDKAWAYFKRAHLHGGAGVEPDDELPGSLQSTGAWAGIGGTGSWGVGLLAVLDAGGPAGAGDGRHRSGQGFVAVGGRSCGRDVGCGGDYGPCAVGRRVARSQATVQWGYCGVGTSVFHLPINTPLRLPVTAGADSTLHGA